MELTFLLNILGTGFFAITGAIAGIRQRMDLLGIVIMAFFVGLGGGTIRNLCLNTRPVWLQDVGYIWAVVLPALITFCTMYFFSQKGKKYIFSEKVHYITRQFFLIFDAIGLGLFAITGAQMALSLNISSIGSMLMGMVTATGGGIIRDLFCNEIPLVFRKEIYATAALIGSGVYVELSHYTSTYFDELISVALVILIRLLSVYCNWEAPRI